MVAFRPASGVLLPSRRHAVRFIVLLGVVSLFADMTYEGARSITGPYLALLGASAATVGIVAGFGELVGYAARLASGWLSDRTGRYWAVTIFGYGLNLFAVPLLALTDRWELAVVLIVAERMGRAIRSPARDAMLSHAASRTGLGWGFGLHEALDQTGAILGPLTVAAVLYLRYGYHEAFALLLVPAVLAMAVLIAARINFPRPRDFDLAPPALEGSAMPRALWIYLAGVALLGAGFADFPLIAYHFGVAQVVAAPWIPVLYALAMGTDAVAALALGVLFDRVGVGAMVLATLLSAAAAPLVFLGGVSAVVIGMACWGIGMGAQESVMRAMIARLAPSERRGTAYGVFNAVYGIAWFAGSALLGVLYDRSILAVAATALALQLAALPAFLWLLRRAPGAGP
ncbi:MAG TPA: MFS transporter [Geminicoccaceae bacterium]|nr:MFS transporter [Geminicoccaceae bacterium]